MVAVARPAQAAGTVSVRGLAWPSLSALVELAALLAVIVLLWPGFERIAQFGEGRDHRYAATGVEVSGLPPPVLPRLCESLAAAAEPTLREAACGALAPRWRKLLNEAQRWLPGRDAATPQAPNVPSTLPPLLHQALRLSAQAFAAPLLEAQAQRQAWQLRQQQGLGDLRANADAVAAIDADLRPYIDRFQLGEQSAESGPRPLQCAAQATQSTLSSGNSSERAEALLRLAAALDGRPLLLTEHPLSRMAQRRTAHAPQQASSTLLEQGAGARCADAEAAYVASTALMAEVRQSLLRSQKNEAMRALPAQAGWQWVVAILLAYAALLASRHGLSPLAGTGAVLLLWSVAAWAARVLWPLSGQRSFEPARLGAAWESAWHAAPANFVLVLGGMGLLLLAASTLRRAPAAPRPRQTMSSRLGFPGLALALGIGWQVGLDLSAHGHAANRYLALYQQGHLWLGLMVFSLLLFLRQPLAQGLCGLLLRVGMQPVSQQGSQQGSQKGQGGPAAPGSRPWLAPLLRTVLLVLAALGGLALFAVALTHQRQLTSELGRIWLIVGAAWFFFLRAGPLARRLALGGSPRWSMGAHAWPLLIVVGMLVAAMVLTHDMGPLLIAGYGSGAFIAAAVAMGWHERGAAAGAAFALALLLFALWIGLVSAALFQLGNIDATTAARLESLAAPLASANDQLALVAWFQRAAPLQGFGLGSVPWCGFAPAAQCSGVPAQVHSDYSFTALVGVFGMPAACALSLGCALWLHRLVRHHGRVTQGEPRLVASGGRWRPDGQALLSWLALGWVVLSLCQLAVTVAGNLGVLPLTGVTFPFVSHGMTSLLVNLGFLALCINVDVPDPIPTARPGVAR